MKLVWRGIWVSALWSVASIGNSVTIEYPDLSGTRVDYVGISEDTRDLPEALFGPPDIVGDTMDFDPLSFTAQATSGAGGNESNIVDGQLNFTVKTKDGFDLTYVEITEAGDFSLAGLGAAQATATLFASVRWSVNYVDGVQLAAPLSGSSELAFTPSNSYSLPDTGGLWDGHLIVDVAQFLQDQGVSGFATEVEFVLDNTLTAAAAEGGSAFLAKKDFAGVTVTIPEPTASWLVLLGTFRAVPDASQGSLAYYLSAAGKDNNSTRQAFPFQWNARRVFL